MKSLHSRSWPNRTADTADTAAKRLAPECENNRLDAGQALSPQEFFEDITWRPDVRDLLERLAR
jgi:hypothetical protein